MINPRRAPVHGDGRGDGGHVGGEGLVGVGLDERDG